MLKQIFVLLNIFSLLLFNLLFQEAPTVTQDFPKTVEVGGMYTVETTITKGDISGFAKFQQTIPDGFVATVTEAKGASFTFNDQKVKFLWISLPDEAEFTISYQLSVDNATAGNASIGGKFSYINGNERQTYDLPQSDITISAPEETVAEEEPQEVSAKATRSVTKTGDNQYQIDITIDKQGVEGFAKLQDIIPADVSAEATENKRAIFSMVDNKAKFVWMSIPEDDPLVVSYTVTADRDIQSEMDALTGEFSYMDNEEITMVEVENPGGNTDAPIAQNQEEPSTEPTQEDTEPEPSTQEEPVTEPVEETTPPEETSEPEPVEEVAQEEPEPKPEPEPVEEEPTPEPEPEPVKEEPKPEPPALTSVPTPQNGVHYRVQIVAGHRVVDKAYFKEYHNYEDEFFMENHEGWVKFTMGGFEQYRGARDKRNEITSNYNFPGPFVTAYNDGERITVQEALMITNQKWYQ